MRHNILTKLLLATALLIIAVPLGVSAQVYNRDYGYDRRGQYDQVDWRQVREARNAMAGLENSSARLESDLNYGTRRRVLGIFELRTSDNSAVAQVRDFRRAVRQLRIDSNNGRDLDQSVNDAQLVLDRGMQLDRYLRLRTGRTNCLVRNAFGRVGRPACPMLGSMQRRSRPLSPGGAAAADGHGRPHGRSGSPAKGSPGVARRSAGSARDRSPFPAAW